MLRLDYNEMAVPEFPEYGLTSFGPTMSRSSSADNLRIRMTFASKEAAQLAMKHYSILRNVVFRACDSDPRRYDIRCVHRDHECAFRVRITYM